MAGGVWQGKRITKGYSEQIRAFAGVSSAEYRSYSRSFAPSAFNPEAIVALAKRGGMKSIILTAKHHDGFNLFTTSMSNFSVPAWTSTKRDLVEELSAACCEAGLKFGVYFSLLDWDHPSATPPDRYGANDNDIPPSHEALNMAQVGELLSGSFWNISELWFDMGRPSVSHSEQLTQLVHRLQPGCLVSGRVWNHRGDYACLSDNQIPSKPIHEPWQTPVSMFHETWGYRKWQQRGDVQSKIDEHVENLVKVVSRGGNLLLNIGPMGDGSILDFEAAVVEGVGAFLKRYGEAVYNTVGGPMQTDDIFSTLKRGRTRLFLFVKQWPSSGVVTLSGLSGRLRSARLMAHDSDRGEDDDVQLDVRDDALSIDVRRAIDRRADCRSTVFCVVVLDFDSRVLDKPDTLLQPRADGTIVFSTETCEARYSYNGRGYYEAPLVKQYHCHFNANDKLYQLHDLTGPTSGDFTMSIDGRAIAQESSVLLLEREYHTLIIKLRKLGHPLQLSFSLRPRAMRRPLSD